MPEKKETINPYVVLGVGNEQAEALNEELDTLMSQFQFTEDFLNALATRYDPKCLIMGMFLGSKFIKLMASTHGE